MTLSLSPNLLKTMIDWVDMHIGLKISDGRYNDFAKGICLAAADSGFEEPQEYIRTLIKSTPGDHELGFLASYLTIGETYFFRDPLSYNLLTSQVLPPLLAREEPIKIWSAGCATGEEPYSIAITALSSMSNHERQRLEIIATDINPRYLEIAKAGLYRRWSFREVPAFIKEKYFQLTADDRYCLSDRAKQLVRFSNLNLASDSYPSAITGTNDVDVIFCRNVLIYFSPEHVTEVLARFHRCLKEGGYLFLAPSEIPHPAPENFKIINIDGAILLQKETNVSSSTSPMISIVKSNFSYFGQSAAPGMKSFESLIDVNVAGKIADKQQGELSVHEAAALLESLRSGLSDVSEGTAHGVSSLTLPSDLDLSTLTSPVGRLSSPDMSGITDADSQTIISTAHTLYQSGKYGEAIDLLLEVPANHDAVSEEALLLLVRAYANIGNLDAAMDWSERLIGYEPVNARWYYLRATIQQELGENGAALISLRQAIFLQPEYILAHFALGNIHQQSGSHKQAKRCFERVIDLLEVVNQSSEIQDSDGLMAGQLKTITISILEGG